MRAVITKARVPIARAPQEKPLQEEAQTQLRREVLPHPSPT